MAQACVEGQGESNSNNKRVVLFNGELTPSRKLTVSAWVSPNPEYESCNSPEDVGLPAVRYHAQLFSANPDEQFVKARFVTRSMRGRGYTAQWVTRQELDGEGIPSWREDGPECFDHLVIGCEEWPAWSGKVEFCDDETVYLMTRLLPVKAGTVTPSLGMFKQTVADLVCAAYASCLRLPPLEASIRWCAQEGSVAPQEPVASRYTAGTGSR